MASDQSVRRSAERPLRHRVLRRASGRGSGGPIAVSVPAKPASDVVITPTDAMLGQLVEREPSRYERWVKPVVDRAAAAVLLLLLSPVLVTVALLVWATLGGPIMLRQKRIGLHGRPFHMLKFRTMHPDRRRSLDAAYAGPERRLTHKSPDDPRHTRLGRKLRRSSLDELPQLLNVLRGDMSMVGPRPELPHVVHGYRPWQNLRHVVRPGLTGLWQTTERANGTLMHEHIELDIEYVTRLSAREDLRILMHTPSALFNKGQVH